MKKTTLILAGIALIASVAMWSMIHASGVQINLTPSIVDDGTTVTFSSDIVFDLANQHDIGSTNLGVKDLFIASAILSQAGGATITFSETGFNFRIANNSLFGIEDGELSQGIVFNNAGLNDMNLRIETDTVTDALFVDAGAEEAAWNVPLGHDNTAIPLGAAAITFATATNFLTVTGDGGANTIATITNGIEGQMLSMLFVDALVTITDDDSHAADSVDLSAAFTSADDTTLTILYDGTSWYEISRSIN